jgi:hypothetical protein
MVEQLLFDQVRARMASIGGITVYSGDVTEVGFRIRWAVKIGATADNHHDYKWPLFGNLEIAG